MGGNSLEFKIDRGYLEKILGAIDVTKMNMRDVVFHVYDSVYIKYQQKYYQEYMMRTSVEKRMIKKNSTMDMLNARIAQLLIVCEEAGAEIPAALTEDEVLTNARTRISEDSKEEAK